MSTSNTNQEFKQAIIATSILIVGLTLVKHLAQIGIGGSIGYTLMAAYQLYAPLYLTRHMSDQYQRLGLNKKGLKQELLLVFIITIIVFPLFAIGHHYYQTIFFHRTLLISWPHDIIDLVLTHFIAVALPEELFYRGYLQPILEKHWPAQRKIFGVPMGKAVFIVALLFALGHFVGEYNIVRLGPFFPSLLFSWLRKRRGNLWGAVTFHGIANLIGAFLFQLYTA